MLCDLCNKIAVRPYRLLLCSHVICTSCLLIGVYEPIKDITCTLCKKTGRGVFMREYDKHIQDINRDGYIQSDLKNTNILNYKVETLSSAIKIVESKKKMEKINKMSKTPLVYYLDFEATDKTPSTCRITQIGCVGSKPDGTIVKYNELVRADRPICKAASEITGITDEMLRNSPKCKPSLLKFFKWIDDNRDGHHVTFVAHNGFRFDYPLLIHEMIRWDLSPFITLNRHGITLFYDSLEWARINIPSHKLIKRSDGGDSFKLGDIYESLFKERFEGAHDALADCYALKRICESPYCIRKKIDIHSEDFYNCRSLKDCISSVQTKAESIEKTNNNKLKTNIKKVSKNVMLTFIQKAKRKPTVDVEEEIRNVKKIKHS